MLRNGIEEHGDDWISYGIENACIATEWMSTAEISHGEEKTSEAKAKRGMALVGVAMEQHRRERQGQRLAQNG